MPRPELQIPLPNGCTLRCGEGTTHQWGGDVRICDPQGKELLYWAADEWGDDPELVVGAIFSAATSTLEELRQRKRELDRKANSR